MILIPMLILTLLLVVVGLRTEVWAENAFFANPRPQGRMVDVGGYRLHMVAQGQKTQGRPTVVFISGHGDWSRCWQKVMPEIARYTRAVAYDRPSFGWSDPSPHPRTPECLVRELHCLLDTAGETGPYLLVGHSMGAALSRLFHQRYPDDVVGMVWIDSAHERIAQFIPFWRAAYSGFLSVLYLGTFLAQLGLIRRFGVHAILMNYPSTTTPEEQAILAGQTVTARFFRALTEETITLSKTDNWGGLPKSLGSLPVIAIEASYATMLLPKFTARWWNQFLAGWQAMHTDLRGLSTNLRWITARSGHNVMNEQPQLVIQAVHDILTQVQTPVP